MPRAKAGHSRLLTVKRRLRMEMTVVEQRLWSRLRLSQLQGHKFRRQHGIGPYIVDFYCPERSLVLEVDGETHAEANQMRYDKKREAYLKSLGLRIVRYTNEDVLHNLEGVWADLERQVGSTGTSPSPSLPRRGEE